MKTHFKRIICIAKGFAVSLCSMWGDQPCTIRGLAANLRLTAEQPQPIVSQKLQALCQRVFILKMVWLSKQPCMPGSEQNEKDAISHGRSTGKVPGVPSCLPVSPQRAWLPTVYQNSQSVQSQQKSFRKNWAVVDLQKTQHNVQVWDTLASCQPSGFLVGRFLLRWSHDWGAGT